MVSALLSKSLKPGMSLTMICTTECSTAGASEVFAALSENDVIPAVAVQVSAGETGAG